MNREQVTRKAKADRHWKGVYIKITERQSDWLKANNFSPTAILQQGIKELGFE